MVHSLRRTSSLLALIAFVIASAAPLVQGYVVPTTLSRPQTRAYRRRDGSASWGHQQGFVLHSTDSSSDLFTTTTGTVHSNSTTASTSSSSASFGDVVRLSDRPKAAAAPSTTAVESFVAAGEDSDAQAAASLMRRNTIVAAASIAVGTSNWLWRYTHPERPLSILLDLQAKSAPLATIGRNGRPTVVDIWAPWCETCQQAAATLAAVEAEYTGRVNFVVLNGDDWETNGKVIAALGADAIPHVAMIEADGTVSTALIGAVPKRILEADIDVLLENAAATDESIGGQRKALPHQMYDAFQGRPESARRVLF